jgi:DMSO/TMAO reductase YedYZ molybdopterin-dependent catalytic subunit
MALVRPKSSSVFRPAGGVDQRVMHEHRDLVERIDRRNVLRGALSLGALAMLSGCKVTDTEGVQAALRAVSSWNDGVQHALFRPDHLAPTFPESQVLKPPRFNAFYPVEDVKAVDVATWKLDVTGRVREKKAWTAKEIYALPEQEMIIRHICVEGWDYIGQWSGVNLRLFLDQIGADTASKYIAFHCVDGYTECLDMETALHPQTMLATKYGREILTEPYGFPLRLRTATKLGFKNAKWLVAMEVTNTFVQTHFGAEGFNWFSGI